MVRIVGLLVVLAIGVVAGSALAYRDYGATEDRFGPFVGASGFDEEALAARLGGQTSEARPVVELPEGTRYDFGTMERNTEAEHSFLVRNDGKAPLQLKITGSSCKCTVGDLEDAQLAPGEETRVTLTWKAITESTSFSQNATLATNDPLRSEIQLQVTGRVVDRVLVEPNAWVLDEVATGGIGELTSTLYVFDPRPLRILKAGWGDERIGELSEHEFVERPVDPQREPDYRNAEQAVELRVRVAPGLEQGALRETFRVHYTFSDDPQPAEEEVHVAELTLSATVVGPISVIGGSRLKADQSFRYALGETTVGTPLERKVLVLLRGPDRHDVTLSVAETEPSDVLTAELGEPRARENSILYPLIIRIPAGAPASVKNGQSRSDFGTITLDSGHDRVPPVKIFVTYSVLASDGTVLNESVPPR